MNRFLSMLWTWISLLFSTKRRAATTLTAAILAAAAAFIGPWEGERTEAYLARMASAPVWTVC